MRKAFTLIELLVVLALISLLVSIVGPSGKRMYEKFTKRLDKVKEVGIKNDKEFIRFLEDKLYFMDDNQTVNLDSNKSDKG